MLRLAPSHAAPSPNGTRPEPLTSADTNSTLDAGLESPRIDYNDELSITTGYQQVCDAPPTHPPNRDRAEPSGRPSGVCRACRHTWQVLDATGGTLDALYNNGAFALL